MFRYYDCYHRHNMTSFFKKSKAVIIVNGAHGES